MTGKLTVIMRYWTLCIDSNGKHIIVLFGLGVGILVNSTIVLPMLKEWRCTIDVVSNMQTASLIKRRFNFKFEPTCLGILGAESFIVADFMRPGHISVSGRILKISEGTSKIISTSCNNGGAMNATMIDGKLTRTVTISQNE